MMARKRDIKTREVIPIPIGAPSGKYRMKHLKLRNGFALMSVEMI